MTQTSKQDNSPLAVQRCHELLLWFIPLLDQFPRNRRFTLGERIESGLFIVPMLQRGNAVCDAPASCLGTLERSKMNSHAGAWELLLTRKAYNL